MTNKATDHTDSKDSVGTPDPSESYPGVSLETTLASIISFYAKTDFEAELIADILDAFKQAGWIKEINISLPAVTDYVKPEEMTGQEFYDKFETEFRLTQTYRLMQPDFHKDVFEAARRAAGLHD